MKQGFPLEILNHCEKYDYIDLANSVALNTLSYSLDKITSVLTCPGLLAKWVRKPSDKSIEQSLIPFRFS